MKNLGQQIIVYGQLAYSMLLIVYGLVAYFSYDSWLFVTLCTLSGLLFLNDLSYFLRASLHYRRATGAFPRWNQFKAIMKVEELCSGPIAPTAVIAMRWSYVASETVFVGFTSWLVFSGWPKYVLILGLMNFLSALMRLAARFFPPSILFLARSTDESTDLYLSIMKAMYPLRVMSALRIESGALTGVFSQFAARQIYRTSMHLDWIETIKILASLTVTAIVDARTSSPDLDVECSLFFHTSLETKLFLIGDADEKPIGLKGNAAFYQRVLDGNVICISADVLLWSLTEHPMAVTQRRRLAATANARSRSGPGRHWLAP